MGKVLYKFACLQAAPSRNLDHPRPWEEDEIDRGSSYRSSVGRSVGTIPAYNGEGLMGRLNKYFLDSFSFPFFYAFLYKLLLYLYLLLMLNCLFYLSGESFKHMFFFAIRIILKCFGNFAL